MCPRSSDGRSAPIATGGRLPIATKGYRLSVQRYIIAVLSVAESVNDEHFVVSVT
jgi:hypothetical protein